LAIDSSEPFIRASAEFLIKHFGTLKQIKSNQLLTFQFAGAEQFVQVTPFTLEPGLDWLIVSIIPELDFMTPLHHNTYLTLLLSCIALISTLLIGMVTTKWILKPIWQLDTATQLLSRVQWCQQTAEEFDEKKIVSLTLNTVCWVPSELENLAQAFNRLVEQLKHSFVILRESEHKLTQFLEAMPVGILITNAQGKIYYTNQRVHQIFRQSVETVLEHFYVAGTQQLYALHELPHIRALQGETVAVSDIEIRHSQGIIPLEVWAKPIYDNQGNIIYSISVIQDISERKRAESEREQFTTDLRSLNKAYERFIPREFIKLLGKKSIVDVQLGDQVEKEMTILFADIRGFTSISEGMQPPDIFDFINNYLGQMEPIILHHHGVIDKYIGDAIMALFPICVEDAIDGSIAMLKALAEYNHLLHKAHYPHIKIGIGLNTGSMMVGTIGGQSRMDGTVIADAVNIASRVEGLTKTYGSRLLITEQTFLKLRNILRYHIRVMDRVRVKGKSQYVTVYEIFDADPPSIIELKKKTLHNFEQGFMCFHHENYDKARQFFAKVLEINAEDEAAKIYLSRCRRDFWTSYEKVMRRLDG
jgi:PAS domain S-box-containing protein